jgi:aryl-alcohol dehydrogenase-like predicted oxidoreductase
VGEGIKKFLEMSERKRDELFLQTKFTYARGQDHRKPYDENASYSEQVLQSFETSLQHLKTDHIDSLVLHGPYSGQGIGDEDLEVWATMEALQSSVSRRFECASRAACGFDFKCSGSARFCSEPLLRFARLGF